MILRATTNRKNFFHLKLCFQLKSNLTIFQKTQIKLANYQLIGWQMNYPIYDTEKEPTYLKFNIILKLHYVHRKWWLTTFMMLCYMKKEKHLPSFQEYYNSRCKSFLDTLALSNPNPLFWRVINTIPICHSRDKPFCESPLFQQTRYSCRSLKQISNSLIEIQAFKLNTWQTLFESFHGTIHQSINGWIFETAIVIREHDATRVNKVRINVELDQGIHQTFEQGSGFVFVAEAIDKA